MIQYLLDTNIVSYYLRRGSTQLHERVKTAMRHEEAAISSIVRAEIRYGQALIAPQDFRHALIDGLLAQLPTLAWNASAADYYGKLFAQLKKQGRPIGELDTQIAAHALAENLILVTHNTKHFERIEGLKMEVWTKA